MGSFANTLFTIMLGWLQTATAVIWSAFTTENEGSFLQWIGKNWIILAIVLCVIGMVLDLGIYLLRWRPMRVWKSFFNRLRHRNDDPIEPVLAAAKPVNTGQLFRKEKEASPPPAARYPNQTEQEDLSRWEPQEPAPVPDPEPPQKRQVITGAGYRVPDDSPYRRPQEPMQAEKTQEPTPVVERQTAKPEIMTQRKRRSRLIVSDLFNDPEEELYEMPQQLIDKEQAYHQPVYPRNWKRDEGESE